MTSDASRARWAGPRALGIAQHTPLVRHRSIVRRVCTGDGPPFPGAPWVGMVEADVPHGSGRIRLDRASGYGTARVLVRRRGTVRGIVEVAVDHGYADAHALQREIASLPRGDRPLRLHHASFVTVVLCARAGDQTFERALTSLLKSSYASFEVLVVGPSSIAVDVGRIIGRAGDGRVQWVESDGTRLVEQRVHGLAVANGDIVAFVDDEIVVDRRWVRGLVAGLARARDVSCASGLVVMGDPKTAAQARLDSTTPRRGFGASVLRRGESSGLTLPTDITGTCRAFVVERTVLKRVGGYHAYSDGTPASSGSDVDLFLRMIVSGHALGYEPSALAWLCPRVA